MRHLPIFLELNGKAAVVVGGGVVAARRAEHLIRAGARVTAFAAALSDEFREFSRAPNFRHEARDPEPGGLRGCGALLRRGRRRTPARPELARRRRARAHWSMSPTGRSSATSSCPRSSTASPLVIAISTGGASPILGRMLKARLESPIPAAYGRLADLMGGFRGAVAKAIASPGHAPPVLGDGARGADRRTGASRATIAPPRRTLPAPSNAWAPRAPRRRAAKSISSAPGPAIPTF